MIYSYRILSIGYSEEKLASDILGVGEPIELCSNRESA
jgi:hypothetical protein